MKEAIAVLAAAAAIWMVPSGANAAADPTPEILALERRAMDGWLEGNPDPQLAISDPEITYFHAVVDKRLEGLPAVREFFERYRGTPLFDSYEILSPKLQVCGEVAVLTYRLARHNGTVTTFWNASQVYQMKKGGWWVVHSHWSEAKAQLP